MFDKFNTSNFILLLFYNMYLPIYYYCYYLLFFFLYRNFIEILNYFFFIYKTVFIQLNNYTSFPC